ncbi:GntR family transcriptional regulator [Ktedonobacteria bacterium brp13]|nr:GntR family transcriptional regulator [Ktedonobacteria bacterium brp13]
MQAKTNSTGVHASASTYQPQYKVIAEKIIELITTLGLKPNDRLSTEQELATQMGVSRGVVREAIKSLMTMGIVGARRGFGLYVTAQPESGIQLVIEQTMIVEPENIVALFAFRSEQEMITARLATQSLAVSELRELERILIQNKENAAAGLWEPFLESDRAFHVAVAQATHNPFFLETIKNVLKLQSWALKLVIGRSPGSMLASAEEHEAIFLAIKNGDPEEAARAAKAHVESVVEAYRQEAKRLILGDEASNA